ncbi:MAG: chromosome segregation protein SMC [Pseudanabaenaceae cyanobacterium SKYGB_i_bin29]|nr:chromosome segregation protein SMC [Pseudanabaenaceae cyanobacterium SKYG29]MDW8421853.1 chromosome segregation protein SMC [Pseudanabaenaceae cyanobacterium SKYGB_i_bin29]
MYIKQIELSRFKSFGNNTVVPLLPGFTVISGPNGSGKSNILDALLFALGLSTSKGMRADRLPDLVNQQYAQKAKTAETNVTVTFALDDDQEWTVGRKLRVTSQGTYTSTYYINGSPCTLGELHQQLATMCIYPEGYNIVLQGDVTNIISMNAKDRRMIIDELAGVGEFDRKIAIAKEKLAEVKDQEDRYRIIEQELIAAQTRLQSDREKAEKYQQLRTQLEELQAMEVVLQYCLLQEQQSLHQQKRQQLQMGIAENNERLTLLTQLLADTEIKLQELNTIVSTLGERDYLQLMTEIAHQEAEQKNCTRQMETLQQQYQHLLQEFMSLETAIEKLTQQQQEISQEQTSLQGELMAMQERYNKQQIIAQDKRQELQQMSAQAESWLRAQTQLRQQLQTIQGEITPLQAEQVKIAQSLEQAQLLLETHREDLSKLSDHDPHFLQQQLDKYQQQLAEATNLIQTIGQSFSNTQTELRTCQNTVQRLQEEQRQKQRQLDKWEVQQQANQDIQGTKATRLLLEANLGGVHGLVAQLGTTVTEYQLALAVAAGGKLGCIVVDDDIVATQAIQLLKKLNGGRATFLPLNKMKYAPLLRNSDAVSLGAIDYAYNLITFDPQYANVFAYVFGTTLVFASLDAARRHLGRYRMVTLEGELLETSGAMTGGSSPPTHLRFGTLTGGTAEEVEKLRLRLTEIEQILAHLHQRMATLETKLNEESNALQQARLNYQEAQLQSQHYQRELERLYQQQNHLNTQINQRQREIAEHSAELDRLSHLLTTKQEEQSRLQRQLAELERSGQYERIFQLQTCLQREEETLLELERHCRTLQQQISDRAQQLIHLQEKQQELEQARRQNQYNQTELISQQDYWHRQNNHLLDNLSQLYNQKQQLEQTLSQQKHLRDETDRQLQDLRRQYQECQWQLEKLEAALVEWQTEQTQISQQLSALLLPDPLPILPENITMEYIQTEQRRLQKRLQALEPVNMKAIEEYDEVTRRREDLSQRLTTLQQERTELLLRIENFTTLRQEAFMTSFEQVNENFQTIFAELSDGDGYLQLENPLDPLSGGLNLVAHPKGKPVRHLAAMSGGEKSLTALSFIFALQRYRPSPFYAFDEVDMFLDGANVEKLARMVQRQAKTAQFIVVSLRRPMIEAADRTIGVTQAKGTHTQVVGINLK